MLKTPQVLSETPPASADLLSDLLGSMHLAGMVLFRAEFHEPWAVVTPDSCRRMRWDGSPPSTTRLPVQR